MKTQSEKWFEDYCANSGITCQRIPAENNKTPDYEITIDGQRIIVEVKEISRNKDEQESDLLLSERGYGSVLSHIPGNRARKKITDSSAQIKAPTCGIYPSILVLCDLQFGCGQIAGHLDPYNIRVAMYGLEQIHMAVPRDHSVSPYATGMSYGPKRKMTEDHNTTISAIGVLFTPSPNEIELCVYHNKFAAVPLDQRLLAKHGICQFKLEGEARGNTAKWEEVAVQPQP
jgi:hypothetical protein